MVGRERATGKAITQKFLDSNGGIMPKPGDQVFLQVKSLQKCVHGIMMNHIFPDNDVAQLTVILEDRLSKLFDPCELDFEHSIDLVACLKTLRGLSASDSAKVLKTWLNGWVTSYRLHEDLHNCLLGCP